ncbi:uroporphyrin-III C-methyltransferase/precorrin-2 dehydrogenase/sirohydrochlorin ferrochelatase [Stackebrandtia endophytica]|uniref:Uroporphyrin-III C-methyltransferase/precorrin-2 dehydrogenase/sirohydrochlorin ferrochelatase n=1 Tax=Stackebrandtia endophytica TaxID=1496996 RepID=A0A543B1P7_9ACTN|nr:uroporphyrinogen-III C-methyltransferase [Stackebrandtia endophytica]TQL78768.1 uroporphyrin-III C-methyltransferase/precorrin-2 dehydrogenase/sirohydrochlorin ferrochelatase [Stackebrandtia endophytica]
MYPLGLRLVGRRVLVVGGGRVAHRRIPRLLEAGADVVLVSPAAHIALEALADAEALRWHRREFTPSDLAGAWLVLAATDDSGVNSEISALAEDARIFCVRSDDASAATAWTPAVGRHDGLTVATFADNDPRRAAALRDAVADRWEAGDLVAPRFRPAAQPVPAVTLIGGGPGDADLITVAGRRAVRAADVVIADRLAPAALLEDLPDEVEIIDAAKIPYGRQLDQDRIIELMIERALAGKAVARLKGGDGFVFGRGGEELDAATAAGIAVRVIPGVSSALAAPALVGVPVTERGVVHDFTVISGHLAPDDPGTLVDWDRLAAGRGTLVLLMGVRHLAAIAARLIAGGRDAETPVVAVMDAASARQREVRARLADVADADITSPAVIVIGEVARVR